MDPRTNSRLFLSHSHFLSPAVFVSLSTRQFLLPALELKVKFTVHVSDDVGHTMATAATLFVFSLRA